MMQRAIFILFSFAYAACLQHPILVVPGGFDAARWKIHDVELLAASHLWSNGPSDFEAYLTPIGVDIHNNSNEPLAFSFENVILSDDADHASNPLVVNLPSAYTARQPSSEPEKEKSVPREFHDSSERLLGGESATMPTAAFMPDTVRITPKKPLFSWDWSAFRDWRLGLRGIELPRKYSQRALLPQTIPAHNEGHGFLYFPRLPDTGKIMVLRVRLLRPDNSPIDTMVRFIVKRR